MSKQEYRINGFDLIKGFYSLVFEGVHPFKPQHVSLYVFLINQNNRLNWIEWFKCPMDTGMHGACITSKRMYYRCLNDLSDWGLIEYEPGQNAWKAPRISLKVEVSNSTSIIPQGEPVVIPLQEPVQAPVGEPVQTLVPLQVETPIYKPITSNPKPITDNLKHKAESGKPDSLSKKANEIIDNAQEILSEKISDAEFARSVIISLNLITDSGYKTHPVGKANKTHILARRKEGFTLEDFDTVIEKKYNEWTGTSMAYCIRPETLFGTKFESYLNQKSNGKSKDTIGSGPGRNNGFHRAQDTDHTAQEL